MKYTHIYIFQAKIFYNKTLKISVYFKVLTCKNEKH